MTTEDDFHRMLDANPDDHQTRLVLADFLDERGDPRAAGYRALGTLGRKPAKQRLNENVYWSQMLSGDFASLDDSASLPKDWFKLIGKRSDDESFWNHHFNNRREGEDAAAIAFSQLPPERQAELLKQTEKLSRITKAVRRMRKVK